MQGVLHWLSSLPPAVLYVVMAIAAALLYADPPVVEICVAMFTLLFVLRAILT